MDLISKRNSEESSLADPGQDIRLSGQTGGMQAGVHPFGVAKVLQGRWPVCLKATELKHPPVVWQRVLAAIKERFVWHAIHSSSRYIALIVRDTFYIHLRPTMAISVTGRSVNVFHKLFITAILALGLWGCASLPPVEESSDKREDDHVQSDALPEGKGWWYARFHIDRPDDEEIRWYIGTLIGGEVIAPVIADYYRDVSIWRVHRRASRDDYGHVFSFIFYTTPQAAQRIYTDIENHTVVKSLLENGRLTRVSIDDVTRITRPNIEDTSDHHWPVSVQKTWPTMIMGSSRMWLDLVSEFASRESGMVGIEARYKKVQDDISRIWREQGQHAILHHINAVFSYQPMLIRY